MTVLVLNNCPAKLRGDITKWMYEINTGVYVGHFSARVRSELWDRICDNIGNGKATMVFRTNNEQKVKFWVHNTLWEPVDFDGITLMRRPLPEQMAVADDNKFISKERTKAFRKFHKKDENVRIDKVSDSYIVIDIETTGLNPFQSEILELGAVKVINGNITDSYDSLINIKATVPQTITKMTGITDEMLKNGISLQNAIEGFIKFIGNETLVAHNIAFDIKFLQNACKICGFSLLSNKTIDVLALARRRIPGLGVYKLQALKEYFNMEGLQKHRALADANDVYQVYMKLKEIGM